MNELSVRIVKLEPMTVAVSHGFGENPESIAWQKIVDFIKSKRLLDEFQEHRFFGFNNPSPTPGSPNYGYEQWMTVSKGTESEGDIKIQEYEGGTYAVRRCDGLSNIGQVWHDLVTWFEDSHYVKPQNWEQCLEEVLNPRVFITPEGEIDQSEQSYEQVSFDLYLPVTWTADE